VSPDIPSHIGRYAVLRKIGGGGMGEVFAARDERLGRTVAIKTILNAAGDDSAVRRFLREARAAAAVNHPNVCQIYDVDQHDGGWFLAMELLDGEPLERRLERGAIPFGDALGIIRQVLAALGALHGAGIVHRDLKPSNVFLATHGVKLLDFGIARPVAEAAVTQAARTAVVTQPGMIFGTPGYMAPEQVEAGLVDHRADIYAAGTILFEMLAGRPAFTGFNAVALLYAAVHEQPPALQGSSAVAAVDRVIRRAMSKRPSDRYADAAAMAEALRDIREVSGQSEAIVPVSALTRVVVLPFRVLRPDPEIDFLGYSLADATATSLASLPSVIVRSSALAAGIQADQLDLRRIAAEVDVDLVLMGTLVRAGPRIRASVQVVETSGGTIVGAITAQAPVDDLFHLEDELSRKVADVIAPRLAARTTPVSRDVPSSAKAYEFYLRGNELARLLTQAPLARDMYLACLAEDDSFAPAWAALGRSYRLIGKFMRDPEQHRTLAQEALQRALTLNPQLSSAHQYVTNLEAELGLGPEAVGRLVRQLSARRNEPALLVGLVTACRYSGLYDESILAHEEARRLDPHAPTGGAYTLLAAGELDRLIANFLAASDVYDGFPTVIAAILAGRRDLVGHIIERSRDQLPPNYAITARAALLLAEGSARDAFPVVMQAVDAHDDPEVPFVMSMGMAAVGDHAAALSLVERAVHGGFYCLPTLERFEGFTPLRGDPLFHALAAWARERRDVARGLFVSEGGERLLRA
jgi:TolB-like protein